LLPKSLKPQYLILIAPKKLFQAETISGQLYRFIMRCSMLHVRLFILRICVNEAIIAW